MTGLFVSGRSWRRSAGRGSIWGLVINRSNSPLCKTRALLGLIKDEYHRSQITRRRPHGERWPAAWRNHNPYSDRILTSTSRQIKKSRVSHSDSDFFHLNLSLNRKSPNHQTKKSRAGHSDSDSSWYQGAWSGWFKEVASSNIHCTRSNY